MRRVLSKCCIQFVKCNHLRMLAIPKLEWRSLAKLWSRAEASEAGPWDHATVSVHTYRSSQPVYIVANTWRWFYGSSVNSKCNKKEIRPLSEKRSYTELAKLFFTYFLFFLPPFANHYYSSQCILVVLYCTVLHNTKMYDCFQ